MAALPITCYPTVLAVCDVCNSRQHCGHIPLNVDDFQIDSISRFDGYQCNQCICANGCVNNIIVGIVCLNAPIYCLVCYM